MQLLSSVEAGVQQESCGTQKWGQCGETTEILSPVQLVPAGVRDGRRLYIHEDSFQDLAMRHRAAAGLVLSSLVALPAVKLVHHDLVEEAVAIHGFDPRYAAALQEAIAARWFGAVTATLQFIGLRRSRTPPEPLLGPDEKIVATCLDANYYTFATTECAAIRMYADVLKVKAVRALVRMRGDAYRDLTMIRGRRLALVNAESGGERNPLSAEELRDLKVHTLFDFETALARIIDETIPRPTETERQRLAAFQTKCVATARYAVLHLRDYPNTSRRRNTPYATSNAPTAQAPSSTMQNVIDIPSYGGAWPV